MTLTLPDGRIAPRADRLTLNVYGLPAPQGSKRVVRGRLIDANADALHTWREDVKQAALAAMADNPAWLRNWPGVALHATFTLPRPASHFRTSKGERTALLHEWAPTRHTVRPDLDKLLRAVGDALTAAGAYVDDSRVFQTFAVKTYPASAGNPFALDRPGARLTLTGVGK